MDQDTSIILIVIAGTLIMVVLIIAIILFAVLYNRKMAERESQHQMNIKNKELDLLRAVINTQETEREKIARNLHDEVGPLVSSLKLKITKHQRDLKNSKLEAEALNDERELIDVLMESVRGVSHDLSPQFMIKYGLVKSLQQYVGNLENIQTEFTTNIPENERVLERQVKVNTYRVIMELLNNILKHDKPGHLSLSLIHNDGFLTTEITHDGNGISNKDFAELSAKEGGLGLDSLKSRIVILNAQLIYENHDGAKVKLIVPSMHNKEY